MQSQFKKYQTLVTDWMSHLNDIRFVGQVLFGIIVLLISWSGAKAVQTNYNLQKQISVLEQQNAVQQLQNNNLKLQNQYYNTNEYLELSARQNFGLANPGETEVLVPKNVALANTVSLPQPDSASSTETNHGPRYQQNLRDWFDFFLHRPTATD